jgi:hypothetical protein
MKKFMDEWNKGYEKGRDDYCCNGNCNQGRTCPLRTKTLTNEEIISEWIANERNYYNFARAILRKAQEK